MEYKNETATDTQNIANLFAKYFATFNKNEKRIVKPNENIT